MVDLRIEVETDGPAIHDGQVHVEAWLVGYDGDAPGGQDVVRTATDADRPLAGATLGS